MKQYIAAAQATRERMAELRRMRLAHLANKKVTTPVLPALQIRTTNGESWLVRAQFPDGSFEDIPGFRSENEANEWVAKELQGWLDRRGQHKSG
jgi:hypothetical protein